jgi:hypothetical protein
MDGLVQLVIQEHLPLLELVLLVTVVVVEMRQHLQVLQLALVYQVVVVGLVQPQLEL